MLVGMADHARGKICAYIHGAYRNINRSKDLLFKLAISDILDFEIWHFFIQMKLVLIINFFLEH